jgi:hypothetical protein
MQPVCIECGQSIPQERLEALPDTETCVLHSKEQKRVGVTVWDRKTPELIIVQESEAEFFRRMEKLDGRESRLK